MKMTSSRSFLGGLLAALVIGTSSLAHASGAREKGMVCTTTVKASREGVELSAKSKHRVDRIEEARQTRSVHSFPQRDIPLGRVTIIESVLTLNFEQRRPRAIFEVVFEVQRGPRDSIKLREVGRGKSLETRIIPLSDGTTLFVEAEVSCGYYRS